MESECSLPCSYLCILLVSLNNRRINHQGQFNSICLLAMSYWNTVRLKTLLHAVWIDNSSSTAAEVSITDSVLSKRNLTCWLPVMTAVAFKFPTAVSQSLREWNLEVKWFDNTGTYRTHESSIFHIWNKGPYYYPEVCFLEQIWLILIQYLFSTDNYISRCRMNVSYSESQGLKLILGQLYWML
jgi:hypothetical protein